MILLEWVFDPNFPDPELVRGMINDMNKDISCVYLKELSRDPSSDDYINGSKGEEYQSRHCQSTPLSDGKSRN